MKIAFINIYSGIVERGSEVFTHEIAEVLGENNQIDVYQTGHNVQSTNYSQIILKNIPYIKNQGFIYQLVVIWFTLKLLPFLFIKKYDWIIPINGGWQAFLVRIVRVFTRSKILISGHAGIGRDDILSLLLGAPNFFVALSPKAYTWANSIYRKESVKYIPNGINLTEFKPKKGKVTVDLRRPIILCVSELLPYKRVDLLIKAVSQTQASLLIIGDGPLKEEIITLGQNLLKERFKHISHIPHTEICNYYQLSDLFSLPSRSSEAFGLVYLEAMATNVPVVAPDDTNRRELIGEAGEFCNVENAKEYAQALEKALTTNYYDKPKKQITKYSWKNIGQSYENILKQKSQV